mmetsp:Transcript_30741/g.56202  ORF Transcript_30741/g.56202 Transcript_30741/m.56202 type:complete len:230 (+) Transcript_30741:55-744(+)
MLHRGTHVPRSSSISKHLSSDNRSLRSNLLLYEGRWLCTHLGNGSNLRWCKPNFGLFHASVPTAEHRKEVAHENLPQDHCRPILWLYVQSHECWPTVPMHVTNHVRLLGDFQVEGLPLGTSKHVSHDRVVLNISAVRLLNTVDNEIVDCIGSSKVRCATVYDQPLDAWKIWVRLSKGDIPHPEVHQLQRPVMRLDHGEHPDWSFKEVFVNATPEQSTGLGHCWVAASAR